jgi:hypothetical protein
MSKVCILEPLGDGFDMSSLEEFGKLTIMFDKNGQRCPPVFHTEEFMAATNKWFTENFDPEEDYFVVAGRATKIAFALVAMYDACLDSCDSKLRTLVYDGSVKGYVERNI